MCAKSATVPRRPNATKNAAPLEIVVRRGAVRRFDALKTGTSELSVVVRWDRRTSDRRASDVADTIDVPRDRRGDERRQKPPFTWDLADFVLVDTAAGSKAPRKRKAKKG